MAQERPGADPGDVESVDAIMEALYDVISGPANHPRDWDRFHLLLTPTCQCIPIFRGPDDEHRHRAMSADEFVADSAPYFDQNSFYEIEVARKEERYGNLVHAFSTYHSYHSDEDVEPFQRGINSIQILYEDGRWWITNIAWQPAWHDLAIPDGYLPQAESDQD